MMSVKLRCGWCIGMLAALGGSACGDSEQGERAVEAGTGASLPSPAAAGAPSTLTPGAMPSAAMASAAMTAPAVPPAAMTLPPAATPPAAMPPAATPPAGNFPGEACDGCARFFLPMTGENQRGDFELDLAAPLDLTGATLRFRLLANAFSGNAGGVSVYVRDAGNFDKGFVWTNLTSLGTWTEVAVDFTTMLAGNPSFDITKVAKVGVQLNSAGTFAGASWQNATVYLDSVRVSNAPAADLSFADGIGDFSLVSSDAPAGSSVGFIAPSSSAP